MSSSEAISTVAVATSTSSVGESSCKAAANTFEVDSKCVVSIPNLKVSTESNVASLETECAAQELFSPTFDAGIAPEKDWDSVDDDFMKDIVKELDNLESDHVTATSISASQIPKESVCHSRTTQITTIKKLPFTSPSQSCGTVTPLQTMPVNLSSVNKPSFTPSRTECISHIAPITLLPSGPDKLSISKQTFKTDSSLKCMSMPASKVSLIGTYLSPSHSQMEKTSLVTKVDVKRTPTFDTNVKTTINETPPSEMNASPVVPSASKCEQCIPRSSDKVFRTPNTSEWMRHKSLCSSSLHSASTICTPQNSTMDRVILACRGKVTPPLCNCGRRAKRRTVSTAGPNEGRPFYVCPNGSGSSRRKGCNFFKWECHVSTGIQKNVTGNSCYDLNSEYSE